VDPKNIQVEPEALRSIPRDVCARLRVFPLALATEGTAKVMRLAMADPTDTSAVAEIEALASCEIDVSALPLSAIDELVDKGYRQLNTAVVSRPGNPGGTMFVTSRGKDPQSVPAYAESEVSVTAQIPISALRPDADDLDMRLTALVQLLVNKGLITEAELIEALVKLKSSAG
jgi:Type II secretion system (T2SS), protein E, N-terminal domain